MDVDEAQDWAWCDAQFAAIEAYVKAENIPHVCIVTGKQIGRAHV